MTRSESPKKTIAIFLNALVCPGVGHIYMGYKVRGYVLAIACVFFIVAPLAKFVFAMSYAMNMMRAPSSNPVILLSQAAVVTWPDIKGVVLSSIAGIIIIWVYGIVDIYMKSKGAKDGRM